MAPLAGTGQNHSVRGDQGRGGGTAPKATRCASCGRPIFNPAVLIGRAAFGPVCAKKAGLLQSKRRKVALQGDAKTDPLTLELFEEVECA